MASNVPTCTCGGEVTMASNVPTCGGEVTMASLECSYMWGRGYHGF